MAQRANSQSTRIARREGDQRRKWLSLLVGIGRGFPDSGVGQCPCCRSDRLVPAEELTEREVPSLWHCQSCDRWLSLDDVQRQMCVQTFR